MWLRAARLSETNVAFAGQWAGQSTAPVETAIAFACSGRASPETAVAFAGEKRVYLVRFSVAEVSPVSMVVVQG